MGWEPPSPCDVLYRAAPPDREVRPPPTWTRTPRAGPARLGAPYLSGPGPGPACGPSAVPGSELQSRPAERTPRCPHPGPLQPMFQPVGISGDPASLRLRRAPTPPLPHSPAPALSERPPPEPSPAGLGLPAPPRSRGPTVRPRTSPTDSRGPRRYLKPCRRSPSAPSRRAGCRMREDALPEQDRPSATRAQRARWEASQSLGTRGSRVSCAPSRKGPQSDRGGRRGMEFRERWAAAADYNSQRPVRQPLAPGRGAPPWSCRDQARGGARLWSGLRVRASRRGRAAACGSTASRREASPAALPARRPRGRGLLWLWRLHRAGPPCSAPRALRVVIPLRVAGQGLARGRPGLVGGERSGWHPPSLVQTRSSLPTAFQCADN